MIFARVTANMVAYVTDHRPMQSTFAVVDLTRLPFPAVVEPLDFEVILAELIADVQDHWPAFSAHLESEPVYMLLQVFAAREINWRQRVNDAARAITLAYAVGSDLDHIAARYNVARLVVSPEDRSATPPVPAVLESDNDLRRRVQLAFEGFSTAGPAGAYLFHALSASGEVLDASVESPSPGVVVVTVLSRSDDGTASPALLGEVLAGLNDERVRPLTDMVTVQSAEIVTYTVDAVLTLYPGPDSSVVLADANNRLQAYTDENNRLGRDITRAGLIAALCTTGVQNVALLHPSADIVISAAQAARCEGSSVVVGGYDE